MVMPLPCGLYRAHQSADTFHTVLYSSLKYLLERFLFSGIVNNRYRSTQEYLRITQILQYKRSNRHNVMKSTYIKYNRHN